MEKIITAIGDITVLIFDLLIYMNLTALKRDTKLTRIIAYSGCAVILCVYFAATYFFNAPAAISSFLCMSLPSFVLFWLLSKYKDARFFVTFCLVDTISLIIAFYARIFSIYFELIGAIIGTVFTLAVFLIIYIKCRPYFSQYRELLESIENGWIITMISTLLIYAILILTPSYPKPLAERTEYIPVYFILTLTVLSFYGVFITALLQRKKLKYANDQLTEERGWHNIAYYDALTKMRNRMAYIERINAIPRSPEMQDKTIYAIMIDIDGFKKINDTFGHHMGDSVLLRTAEHFKGIFSSSEYEAFRIGGDEFAVIATDVEKSALIEKLEEMNVTDESINCTFSYGFSKVRPEENNAMENAFIRADSKMYKQKNAKKGSNESSADL